MGKDLGVPKRLESTKGDLASPEILAQVAANNQPRTSSTSWVESMKWSLAGTQGGWGNLGLIPPGQESAPSEGRGPSQLPSVPQH